MTDTHTHIYFPEFEGEIQMLIDEFKSAGVRHLILPNVDESTLPQMKELHSRFSDFTSMAMGLHPTEVNEDWQRIIGIVEQEIETGQYVAVGEVGIDLYWDKTKQDLQEAAFESQLRLAEKHNLPVIIHSRDAFKETKEVIDKVNPTVPLVFHSFTGGKDEVKFLREGFDPWFGINGVVTYKNAPALREALGEIGLDRMVLETDSPYLSPVPYRGRPNKSSYMVHVRDKVAECLGISPEEVENATDRNARTIFKI